MGGMIIVFLLDVVRVQLLPLRAMLLLLLSAPGCVRCLKCRFCVHECV
jgi:hypothetical protein